MEFNVEKEVSTKFVEVPNSVSIGDKIRYLNLFLSDLQRNGFVILSVGDLVRQESGNGLVEEGFVIEYREVSFEK